MPIALAITDRIKGLGNNQEPPIESITAEPTIALPITDLFKDQTLDKNQECPIASIITTGHVQRIGLQINP